MRCWRCGQEVADGASFCVACGSPVERATPTSDAGRTMRTLYDRYGADAVLGDPAYLGNGLGDLLPDSTMLRSRLRMAIDAGAGRLYLEQVRGTGAPDAAFGRRVHALLVDGAGLSDAAAGEVAALFDEMVGWKAAPAKKATPTHSHGSAQTNPLEQFNALPDEEKDQLLREMFEGTETNEHTQRTAATEEARPVSTTSYHKPAQPPAQTPPMTKVNSIASIILLGYVFVVCGLGFLAGGIFLIYIALTGQVQSPTYIIPVLVGGVLLSLVGVWFIRSILGIARIWPRAKQ